MKRLMDKLNCLSVRAKKNINQRFLRNNRGVTLMELVVTILIMLLSTATVTVGMSLAIRTYRECVEASEAQILCSSLTTAISDKLRYCGTVKIDRNGKLQQIFIQSLGKVDDGDGEALRIEDGKVMLGSNKLIGSGVYPRGLKVSTLEFEYNETSRIFTITLKISDSSGHVLAENNEFQVKKIN